MKMTRSCIIRWMTMYSTPIGFEYERYSISAKAMKTTLKERRIWYIEYSTGACLLAVSRRAQTPTTISTLRRILMGGVASVWSASIALATSSSTMESDQRWNTFTH